MMPLSIFTPFDILQYFQGINAFNTYDQQ